MKTYQGPSLVAARPQAAGKALRALRSQPARAALGSALLGSLLWLAACGQKGPLTLPPAKAPASATSAASSPAR